MKIEAIETIVYKVDGETFETEEEAQEYLDSKTRVIMFNKYGNETTDTLDCMLLYLGTVDDAERFLAECDDYGYICDGIDEESTGFFFWNDDADEYQQISLEDIEKVKSINVNFSDRAFLAIKNADLSECLYE